METLFNRDISEYYTLPWDNMFYDLKSIKREVYEPGEQIIVTSFSKTDPYIWKHFLKAIKTLDIPLYFVWVQTNDETLQGLLDKLVAEIIPWEQKINVTFVDKNLVPSGPRVNDFNIPDTVCLMPFVNLELNYKNEFRTCCQISKTVTDEQGKNFNVYDHSFDEVFYSKSMQDLRTAFLQGVKPPECFHCWYPEKYGRTSMRTGLKHHADFGEQELTIDYSKPRLTALDIKLTTLCNLKCRICGAGQSSSWYQEIKYHFSDELPKIKKIDWLVDNDNVFWKSLKQNLSNIRYITFQGGEPFLDTKHHKLLAYLLEQNKADTFIHYNSNGTIFPESLIKNLLDKFKHVGFSFSIDNVAEKFNYERHGSSNWDVVYNVLKNFSKLDRNRFKIDLHPTFSIFNILDMNNIKELADELDFGIYFGFVEDPDYFSVLNIPVPARKKIVHKLRASEHDVVREIANNLDNTIYKDRNTEFWNEINRIDRVRGECFAETYPDMNKIMLNPV